MLTRRQLALLAAAPLTAQRRGAALPTEWTQLLGQPTDRSITLNVLAPEATECIVEFGTAPGRYIGRVTAKIAANTPQEFVMDSLLPNTRYYYRVRHLSGGKKTFSDGPEYSFWTQRKPGATFSFGVEGDSHPEREGRMYHPELFTRTMNTAAASGLDFYIALGDDFSVDRLHNNGDLNAKSIDQLYAGQRRYFGIVGRSSAFFHVNGNHEHAAKYLLDGTPNSVPVLVGKARNNFYSPPLPGRFYTGDTEPVEHLGLRRDYCAWTWGDALFVTIDPYWHSPVMIDSGLGGGRGAQQKGRERNRDGWATTMGDAQYQWLRKTLAGSDAKYKFVFAHHVLGTGRGAVELADFFEWGGRNRRGDWEFDKKRPGWEMPVHQLFVKHGVTIFFQGHDHLYARQEKDGVIYQETPNPADTTYTAFNKDAYLSGDVLPNSGFLRVTVSPQNAKVDYVRSWLPADEKDGRKHGEIAHSYTVAPRSAKK